MKTLGIVVVEQIVVVSIINIIIEMLLSLLLVLPILYIISEVFSYFHRKKIINKILDSACLPIYKEGITLELNESNSDEITELCKLLLKSNYSIIQIKSSPLIFIFVSNNFFEGKSLIYKIEKQSFTSNNKFNLSIYGNRYNMIYALYFSKKKFKNLFLLTKNNINQNLTHNVSY